MTSKQITDATKLTDGQLVIRAVCNCHGKTWLEVMKIIGTAYKKDIACFPEPSEMVMTIGLERHSKPHEWFTDDLGAVIQEGIKEHACYQFSEELYSELSAIKDNRLAFLNHMNERNVTDKEMIDIIYSWGHMCLYDNMEGYPFIKDESIKHLIPTFMMENDDES